MVNFSDIINFQYTEQDVDKDIKLLLSSGRFHPAYADIVRNFLQPEIDNCLNAVNDSKHHLTIFNQNTMEDVLKRKPDDINPILNRLKFLPEKREFWFNYFVNPTHGRQKEPPLSVLQNGDKKEIMLPFGLVTDAFYTTYTEIHELMHGVQEKYFSSEICDDFYHDHYELLYQGKSRDEAKAIQLADHRELKKELYYIRCFKEQQANSAATCYMMLKAVRTGNDNIISIVEKRLLNESASMSGALMNENLGLAYFEYPATKQIIAEIKQRKCTHLLNKEGLLNWPELYNYTKSKIDEMGYGKEDMYKSLETAKTLKRIRTDYPNDKNAFLQEVTKQIPNMDYPHNKICVQFVEAQQNFIDDRSKNLHNFYHRLANPNLREQILINTTPQMIAKIEEYIKIYQTGKRATQHILCRFIERAREERTRS